MNIPAHQPNFCASCGKVFLTSLDRVFLILLTKNMAVKNFEHKTVRSCNLLILIQTRCPLCHRHFGGSCRCKLFSNRILLFCRRVTELHCVQFHSKTFSHERTQYECHSAKTLFCQTFERLLR